MSAPLTIPQDLRLAAVAMFGEHSETLTEILTTAMRLAEGALDDEWGCSLHDRHGYGGDLPDWTEPLLRAHLAGGDADRVLSAADDYAERSFYFGLVLAYRLFAGAARR